MTQAIVKAGRGDLIPETKNMTDLAKYLLESKMFPNAQNLAGVITIIEYGRELGLPPVASLNTMVIVKGKLTMEAKAMLAVANNIAGVTWKIDRLDAEECTMTFMREGFAPCQVTFTAKEAKEAGLLDKDNWRLYRQDMLFARCASRGIRRIAPDAVLGLYSAEEMRDVEQIDKVAKKDLEEAAKPLAEAPTPTATEPPIEDVPVYEGEVVEEPYVGDEEAPKDFEDTPPEQPDNPECDPTTESLIADIKLTIKREGVDEKEFKTWIDKRGKAMNRKYVGKIGTALRFHKGDPEDIKYLAKVVTKAIELYKKETAK